MNGGHAHRSLGVAPHRQAAIDKGFECHVRKSLPADFMDIDIYKERPESVLSQVMYLEMKSKLDEVIQLKTKKDLHDS